MESRGPMNILPDAPRCLRVRPEAMLNYQRNVSSCGVAKLLQSSSTIDLSFRRSKAAGRNFIKDNVALVRDLSSVAKLGKVDRAAFNHASSSRASRVGRSQLVKPLFLQRSNSHEDPKGVGNIDLNNKATGKASVVNCTRNSFANGMEAPRLRAAQSLDHLDAEREIPLPVDLKENHSSKAELVVEAEVPSGCEEIAEEERRRIVGSIHLAILDLYSKVGHLPVRTDTPGLIRMKEELYGQIEELERAYEIFSKRRVYVQNDHPSWI
uniref:Enkurin domain-containing protein n=1 Tax=Trichuris muris TaxID=70415 RepID=A0A5S6QXN6_TRIMR